MAVCYAPYFTDGVKFSDTRSSLVMSVILALRLRFEPGWGAAFDVTADFCWALLLAVKKDLYDFSTGRAVCYTPRKN